MFLVGTGRCGSTLMSDIVRDHPDLLSLSEVFMSVVSQAFAYPRPDGRAFWRILSQAPAATRLVSRPEHLPGEFLYRGGPDSAFCLDTAPPLLFVCLPHLTDDPEPLFFALEAEICARPRAPIGDHYRFLFERLREQFGKRAWVERSGGSLCFLPSLIEHFPDARFVHLARDGRDVALSIARHPGMRLLAHMWSAMKRIGVDFLKPPFLLTANRPTALLDQWCGRFAPFDALIAKPLALRDAGRFWSESVRTGMDHWGRIPPERRLELRYEDLLARPRATLKRFAAFVGPDFVDGAWLDRAAARVRPAPPRWTELPAAERRELEDACAPGLAVLGYAST